jgi:hypothetical protein
MKQTKITTKLALFLLLALIPPVFSSCSNDDDDKGSNNEIILGNERYKATQVTITGEEKERYGDYYIHITSSTKDQKAFSVELVISSLIADEISGTYNIDDKENLLYTVSGYHYTSFGENWPENDTGIYFSLTEGTCSIKHNKNKNYTITFDIKPAKGERVKGNYTGDVMGEIIKY